MDPQPLVSIIIPVCNDAQTIRQTLASCRRQTLADIEIICVDDASTDATATLIEHASREDARIRLVRQHENRSALQARRVGVVAARAEYALFVDGDDELERAAAERSLQAARAHDADVVGFGVEVVDRRGHTGGTYQARLAPRHSALRGEEVLPGLFPIGAPAQGQLWRHLYRTKTLREAYALIDEDLQLPRINDLPLMFLVAALAQSYVSVPDRLYRYHFGRGGSGHVVDDAARAEFYASAIDSIDSIARAVESVAIGSSRPELTREIYASARQWIIAYVCQQVASAGNRPLKTAALARVYARADAREIVRAAARFFPETLHEIARYGSQVPHAGREPRSILLVAMTLTTGGISSVVAAQARILTDAGYRVSVALRGSRGSATSIPDSVGVYEIAGRSSAERLAAWASMIDAHEVDLVIDHEILSGRDWHVYAGLSRAAGVATIGWIHNFSLRPIHDGTSRITELRRALPILKTVVTLAPLDIVFWKLLGVRDVVFLPNPPSPALLSAPVVVPKTLPAGTLELVWVGRLEQHTKRVLDLIDVAAHLEDRGIDFALTVVGPDWMDLTAKRFNARVAKRGLAHRVRAVGPRHGDELRALLDRAHLFVSTSAIEGYQLTLAEAQARGLPVCMYALPWLTLVDGNDGIVTATPGDPVALASAIASAAFDDGRYPSLSRGALDAAARVRSTDLGGLYRLLLADALPAEFSPEPSLDDARRLVELLVTFAEPIHHEVVRSMPSEDTVRPQPRWKTAARWTLHRLPMLRPLANRLRRRWDG
ncbi:MAG: glycosyltransferase [Microbacterium sp.]